MAEVKFHRLELIERRLDALASRETFNQAGERIGMFLAAKMKINAVNQRIGTSGGGTSRTLNAINYKVRTIAGKTVVEAGVFGVFYARYHEYGTKNFKGTNPSWILFRILENYEKLGLLGRGKGVFDMKTGRLRERPFVRPALTDNIDTVVQMIREEIANAGS